jgi:hypothetical protein
MKEVKLVNKQILNTVSKTEERRALNIAQISNRRKGMEGLVEAVKEQNYFCPKISPNRWAIYKLQ